MKDHVIKKTLDYFEALHQCQTHFLESQGLSTAFEKENYSEKEFKRINELYRQFLDKHNGVWGTLHFIKELQCKP